MTKKIVLLGDPGVGKTSLIRRYVLDQFDDKYIATIGVKISKKALPLESSEGQTKLTMMLFDVLGQHDLRNVRQMYLEGADGAVLIGDLTRVPTIEAIETFWIPEIEKITGNIPKILLGNKLDLVESNSEGVSLLQTISGIMQSPNQLCSAKMNLGVEAGFKTLGEVLVEQHHEMLRKKESPSSIETVIQAADAIMKHFCEAQDSPDVAVEICSAVYREVGFDMENPKREALAKAIELLAEQESVSMDDATVAEHREERLAILNRIK